MINMWGKRQIRIVYNLIKEIDETEIIQKQNIFINALNIILEDKENRIKNLLKKDNCT